MAGVKYSYLPDVFDAIMVFVILPIFHVLNDKPTKDALKDENYFLADHHGCNQFGLAPVFCFVYNFLSFRIVSEFFSLQPLV